LIGTDRTTKIARLRSYLQPNAADIKSLKSCKLTLSLINVLSFRITTDQYRTLNRSIYAVHQSFSLLLLSSDTAYNLAQGCSVVLHVVESADRTVMSETLKIM